MIISKTPCRISFAGGGSDIAAFYQEYGGAVLSVTIDKYIYVSINSKFDHRIRVSYSRTEEVDTIEEVQHPLVRESLKLVNPARGVEITSIADIPSRGTGLGSSSSFTIGLLNCLFAFAGRHVGPEQLAQLSVEIEIDKCGQPIGKQDQYAAAYGDLKMYEFHPDGSVGVSPIVCSSTTFQKLQSNLALYYTGVTRSASDILEKQTRVLGEDPAAIAIMKKIVAQAHTLRHELESNNPDALGELMHEGWMLKRELSDGITNTQIDDWYAKARSAGALGGKILGAGGGGFLLLYAPAERHPDITAALPQLRRVPFKFEREGSKIIFYQPTHLDDDQESLERIACLGY
jgi:D-glycero-alpha-D-manno-heptose-7-phosphate kinase